MADNPVVVDQVAVLQAQLEESNELLSTALNRSAQHLALARGYIDELTKTREALNEANRVIALLREQTNTDNKDEIPSS